MGSELAIDLNIRIQALHGEINIAKVVFEELFIFFVGQFSSDLFAEVV